MATILTGLTDNLKVDKNKCVFCGKCADNCILDNIRVQASPCRQACPLNLNCQGYVQLIARGNKEKALQLVREDIPFPGILGRICHHPCEAKCKRIEADGKAVALRDLKRYLADTGVFFQDKLPEMNRKESAAVIGGGPAGVTAAYCLRKKGYHVVIFEAKARLGGMLANCIPSYRLPLNVVTEELDVLERMGIEIRYNTRVGCDISLKEIVESFDAVIISTGAQLSKKLNIIGEEISCVFGALEFLTSAKKEVKMQVGQRVVVIGGGNTAVDAAQTAYRLGANEVELLCFEDRESMPAFSWEIKDALDEGINIFNGWGPTAFTKNEDGSVSIDFKRCLSVFDEEGKFSPIFNESERKHVVADTVIVAIGQETDAVFAADAEIDMKNGCLQVNAVTMETNVRKLFAAGDIAMGPRTVVDAMAQGRAAAESVNRLLRGLPIAYGRNSLDNFETEFEVDISRAAGGDRVRTQKLGLSMRRNFDEIEYTINEQEAMEEAKRCLSCGEPFGKYRTCWSCLACEVECPEDAIDIQIPYLMR